MKKALTTAALMAASAAAFAHAGHLHDGALGASFAAGLAHPFGGWDHLLAMVTVGAWAATALRGAQRLAAPGAFLAALLVGGLLGMWGVALPGNEIAIAASVALLGVLWLAGPRAPQSVGFALIATAGLAHGLAHGSEMASGASFAGYAAGFLLGSALLHGLGLGAGSALARLPRLAAEACAAAVGLAGLAMLAARI